jgi:hypothetical protein
MSEDKRNIHQRMLAVMDEVKYIRKEDRTVNNQYTFVSHDAVVAKVRPSFIKNGILMQTSIKERAQDGNRTEATGVVRFINVDAPEDLIECEFFGYGVDNQDKGPGKATSYLKKYAILTALMLETGDDPERDLIDHETTEEIEVKKYQHAKQKIWDECKEFVQQYGELYDFVSLDDFTKAINSLDEKSIPNIEMAVDAVKGEMLDAMKEEGNNG